MTEPPPGASGVDRLGPGDVIREWRIIDFLARGSFGQVFSARRDSWVESTPPRALKVFDPILSSAARSSLVSEFGVLTRVDHPHLLDGEDAFDIASGPLAGCVVFVLELADTDLAAELAARGPLPDHEVAALGAEVADGLSALHAAGHLHGDIKPENVLRSGSAWKLGDFGVSSALDGSYATPGGATLDFRPPELAGPEADGRVHRSADIWALGVTLWIAATGTHPFVGSDAQLRHAAVLRGDRRASDAIGPDLAAVLEQRCLTPDPRVRADAADLVDALRDLARPSAAIAERKSGVSPADVTATNAAEAAPEPRLAPHGPATPVPAATGTGAAPVVPDAESAVGPAEGAVASPPADPPPVAAQPADASHVASPPVDASSADMPAAARTGPVWIAAAGAAVVALVLTQLVALAVTPLGAISMRRTVYAVVMVALLAVAAVVARRFGVAARPWAIAVAVAAVTALVASVVMVWG